jgi:hypothetical protein
MAKVTTIFVEYKEELLPKLIPAVIDPIWYPPKDDSADDGEDGNN